MAWLEKKKNGKSEKKDRRNSSRWTNEQTDWQNRDLNRNWRKEDNKKCVMKEEGFREIWYYRKVLLVFFPFYNHWSEMSIWATQRCLFNIDKEFKFRDEFHAVLVSPSDLTCSDQLWRLPESSGVHDVLESGIDFSFVNFDHQLGRFLVGHRDLLGQEGGSQCWNVSFDSRIIFFRFKSYFSHQVVVLFCARTDDLLNRKNRFVEIGINRFFGGNFFFVVAVFFFFGIYHNRFVFGRYIASYEAWQTSSCKCLGILCKNKNFRHSFISHLSCCRCGFHKNKKTFNFITVLFSFLRVDCWKSNFVKKNVLTFQNQFNGDLGKLACFTDLLKVGFPVRITWLKTKVNLEFYSDDAQ